MSTEISVRPAAADDLGPTSGADVTFLPRAVDDGAGVYDGATPELIRELAEAGVSAHTWHTQDQCEFVDERGPVTDIVLDFAVGVASSGGWYALESLLLRRTGRVKVTVVVEAAGERKRIEAGGDAAGVAAALAQLDPFAPEQPH